MKICIPIICRITYEIMNYFDVQAEIIFDLAPHLIATFAIHREYNSLNKWIVTNVETGARVSDIWHSRKKAIEQTKIKLARISQERFDVAVNKLPKMCRS